MHSFHCMCDFGCTIGLWNRGYRCGQKQRNSGHEKNLNGGRYREAGSRGVGNVEKYWL